VGEVGVDDEAMLPEPEPHIPDKPDVSIIPEVADIPDEVDVADDDDISGAAMVPAVASVALPVVIPPPSKVAVDPNIPEGAVPTVEHAVPLLGIAVVPVEKAGAGLIPGDASSVEPSGIPVGETVEPVPIPSGEVAPMVGVGVAIPLTCATAHVADEQHRNDRGNQRKSVRRSPLAGRVAAARAFVAQFRDDPACEAIGHLSIPQ
jgi:hypothetical protein